MMTRAAVGLVLSLVSLTAAAAPVPADLNGLWLGTLELGPVKLRIGFELSASSTGALSGTLISVDQGGVRVPVNRLALIGDELTIEITTIGAKFVGGVGDAADSIEGTFSQGAFEGPLTIARVDELPGQDRPQNPKPPLPYRVEEVTFENASGGHTLAGTLTLPEGAGPFGAAVLVSGSGPQDRDESLFGHKPFLVLADALTRRGVAVLRYDDRGFGESTGDHASATSRDFASDALAAIRYLASRDEIRRDAIGVCGHSEGGLIGPMVAADNPEEVGFLVLIAPPGVVGTEVLASQGRIMEKLQGIPDDAIEAMAVVRSKVFEIDPAELGKDAVRERLEELAAEAPDAYFVDESDKDAAREAFAAACRPIMSPWFQFFLRYDPATALREVRCPVLAVFGEKDIQVIPELNLEPLRAALAEAPTDDVTVRELAGLNHLMQTAETGMVSEYGDIEETMAPAALELMASWAAERVGDAGD